MGGAKSLNVHIIWLTCHHLFGIYLLKNDVCFKFYLRNSYYLSFFVLRHSCETWWDFVDKTIILFWVNTSKTGKREINLFEGNLFGMSQATEARKHLLAYLIIYYFMYYVFTYLMSLT
jgi:hypothetical protein